jgi:hypothetical protein
MMGLAAQAGELEWHHYECNGGNREASPDSGLKGQITNVNVRLDAIQHTDWQSGAGTVWRSKKMIVTIKTDQNKEYDLTLIVNLEATAERIAERIRRAKTVDLFGPCPWFQMLEINGWEVPDANIHDRRDYEWDYVNQ